MKTRGPFFPDDSNILFELVFCVVIFCAYLEADLATLGKGWILALITSVTCINPNGISSIMREEQLMSSPLAISTSVTSIEASGPF